MAIVAAAAGLFWWQRGGPLSVLAVNVTPAQAPGHNCDVTVDVVGTIRTDGRGGIVTYQWQRNDGQTSAVLHEVVAPARHDAVVHLHWTLAGEGTFQATATLSVLAPDALTASSEFTYDCTK